MLSSPLSLFPPIQRNRRGPLRRLFQLPRDLSLITSIWLKAFIRSLFASPDIKWGGATARDTCPTLLMEAYQALTFRAAHNRYPGVVHRQVSQSAPYDCHTLNTAPTPSPPPTTMTTSTSILWT